MRLRDYEKGDLRPSVADLFDLILRRLAGRVPILLRCDMTFVMMFDIVGADSTLSAVVIGREEVLVVAHRLLEQIALPELMDIFNGISSRFGEEEDGPDDGGHGRAGKEEVGTPANLVEENGRNLGDGEVEEPVGHETNRHGQRAKLVGDRLGHGGPWRDRPAKAVERDVEVDHENGHVRCAVNLGRTLADVTVAGDIEHTRHESDKCKESNKCTYGSDWPIPPQTRRALRPYCSMPSERTATVMTILTIP